MHTTSKEISPVPAATGTRAFYSAQNDLPSKIRSNRLTAKNQLPHIYVARFGPLPSISDVKQAYGHVKVGLVLIKGFIVSQRPGHRPRVSLPSVGERGDKHATVALPGHVFSRISDLLLKEWGKTHA
jgi:hypothetical protein